jgi:D-lactate dehydrogenase
MEKCDDCSSLTGSYIEFYDRLTEQVPKKRIFCGTFHGIQFGTDASFYRLLPKIVVKAETASEISYMLKLATELRVPVTFRAAGTSLAGQALSESVLIYLAGAFRNCSISADASKISLEPGVVGGEANYYLAPLGKKIGPDPASINAAMIGGIAANNASGMCCGTHENSYKTVESMKLIFSDGTMLNTADSASRKQFAETHSDLINEIIKIRDEIRADTILAERIRNKFKIKNTTGYGINSFLDFDDPIDIILHLLIGSEGTLAYISEITYRTVTEHPYKASSLIIFKDIHLACETTARLKKTPAAAVELMDRASLRSVEDKPGMPSYLKELSEDAAALLVETRAADKNILLKQIAEVTSVVNDGDIVFPVTFMDKPEDYNKLWSIRKGLFPSVGGARRIGTTVVIEDVVFPIEKLADGTVELQGLMKKNGFPEGIIFGHALDGNLHFVFCPDLNNADSIKSYKTLIDEVCEVVVKKYDGSLKGEHGTGRNMAPFVEMEWGRQAYSFMKRLKKAFDPRNIVNPGVVINDNPNVYIENLKPMYPVSDTIDKCIECGFCEPICPSKNLTTTPRQRIVTQREIARLSATHEDDEILKQMLGAYRYSGEQTCATDGLCATVCPVTINTGDFTKEIRSKQISEPANKVAEWCRVHYFSLMSVLRISLKVANHFHMLLGSSLMQATSRAIRTLSGNRIPLWNPQMPTGVKAPYFSDIIRNPDRKVVYFPSCIVRAMGPAKSDPDQRALYDATLSLLEKGDYTVLFPAGLYKLCCGMPFDSKGYFEQADMMFKDLEKELIRVSNNGEIPILCENGSCTYTIKRKIDPRIRIYEPVEFIHAFLMDKLEFNKLPDHVAVHVPCSSVKMGLSDKFRVVASACAEKVIVPHGINCCGFAGDRGLNYPELNAAALADLKYSLTTDITSGYSNSRTCEIGLSLHGGIPYQSIVYLVDRCSTKK